MKDGLKQIGAVVLAAAGTLVFLKLRSRCPKVSLPTLDADWGVALDKLSLDAQALGGQGRSTTLESMTVAELELGGEIYRQACTARHMASRATDMLLLLKGKHMNLGYPVDLYTHCLQAATRAYRDGADDEMIVCALLHDLGEMMCPSNHGDICAAILRPYISRQMHWVLSNHEVFQGYYYFDKCGIDKFRRDRLKTGGGSGSGIPDALVAGSAPEGAYDLCIKFCAKYDQPSFDPEYQNMELEEFRPMLLRVFSKPSFWDQPNNLKSGAVTGVDV